MHAAAPLAKSTRALLGDLVTVNIDSANGFEAAAEAVRDPGWALLYNDLADERMLMSRELSHAMDAAAIQRAASGSALARFHRWWMGMRAVLSHGQPRQVQAEVLRGERVIAAAYRKAGDALDQHPLASLIRQQQQQLAATQKRLTAMSAGPRQATAA
jgi:uncharacterized protein (TIGR02284 family)